MRIVSLLFALFLCLTNTQAQVVYVCSGSSKSKFHLNPDCRGLKNCGSPIKKTTVANMTSKGRQPCKICSSDISCASKKTHGGSNFSQFVASSQINTRNLELPKTSKGISKQIITHTGYTTCYNLDWLIPNWVAYQLTKEESSGTFPRPKKEYEPDPKLRGKGATHYDYSNSGYSRGHMAPAADMKWSQDAMIESFYTSNICPQNKDLNGGVWQRLEDRCRALTNDSSVYICCGPIVSSKKEIIGVNKVVVPAFFFKVICMQRKGKWQAIGFVFPNTSCKGSMFDYAVSVDEVEQLTGHDFFYILPDDVENVIEASWKMKDWQ